jgi:hypothetical protein
MRSIWVGIRLVAELQIGTHELQIGAATLPQQTHLPAKMVVLIAGGVLLTSIRLRMS